MKKLLVLSVALLSSIALISCGGSSDESSEEISSEDVSSEVISTSSEPELSPLEAFAKKVAESKPTKIETRQVYRQNSIGKDLIQKSTFQIEYGDKVKTKFAYEYEYLNNADADEMIGKKTGTIYSVARDVYEVVDGELELAQDAYEIGLIGSLNISKQRYFTDYEFDSDDYLFIRVNNDYVDSLFGQQYNINSVTLEIELADNLLDRLVIKYKTATGASITSTNTYTYEPLTVEVPR